MQLLNDLKSCLGRIFRPRTIHFLGCHDEIRAAAESIIRVAGGLRSVENIDERTRPSTGRCLQIMSLGHCLTFLEQR